MTDLGLFSLIFGGVFAHVVFAHKAGELAQLAIGLLENGIVDVDFAHHGSPLVAQRVGKEPVVGVFEIEGACQSPV